MERLAVMACTPITTTVALRIPYETVPGQQLAVVGSCSCLGCWDPSKAVYMQWGPGHIWEVEFMLDPNVPVLEYKFIVLDDAGSVLCWSPDPNRKLDLTNIVGCSVTVSEHWNVGPRDVRFVLPAACSSVSSSPMRTVASGSQSTGSIESVCGWFGMPPATPSSSRDPPYAQPEPLTPAKCPFKSPSLKALVEDIHGRQADYDELRRDVAQLAAGAPGPRQPLRTSGSQRKGSVQHLQDQLRTLEDLRELAAGLQACDPEGCSMSEEQVLDVSLKLGRYEDEEVRLVNMVGEVMVVEGGCSLDAAVARSIAHAAKHPLPAALRPWRQSCPM